jgi:hypothetical protein
MGNTWITDLQMYIDPGRGMVALPGRARRLIDHFGAIVVAISPQPIEVLAWTTVPCRRRPRRRLCPGRIRGLIAADDRRSHWGCVECGDHVAIAGWEGSPWDARRDGPLH